MAEVKNIGKLFLNKEISINDLSKGVEFEVDYDGQGSDSENESYFEEDAFKNFKNDEDLSDEQRPKFLRDEIVPFHLLRERMEPLSGNNRILKEILKPGISTLVPELSVVMVHYEFYIENQKEPFDSTRRRNKPYKFLLGNGTVFQGFDISVMTMRKDEIARFLIGPENAYGVMGCPPRIPPNSDILIEVELLNFYESKAAIEYEEMTPDEQKKAPFEKVVSLYQVEHKMANDLFHSKCYKQAIARYRKVSNILSEVSVANEEEDEKRKGYLLKLYLNLSQCYINVENPEKAIIYADLALKIDDENPKALYRMGYALGLVGEYERSDYFLNRAKKYKPYEKSINYAIAKLQAKRKQHNDWEKMFCKKAFEQSNSEISEKLPESEEFVNTVKEKIEEFLLTDENELCFSAGYTENQLEVVKILAGKYNLAYVSKFMENTKINKIVKKAN